MRLETVITTTGRTEAKAALPVGVLKIVAVQILFKCDPVA